MPPVHKQGKEEWEGGERNKTARMQTATSLRTIRAKYERVNLAKKSHKPSG